MSEGGPAHTRSAGWRQERPARHWRPPSGRSWVGGGRLVTGIRPTLPAAAGPLYHCLRLLVLWSNTAANVSARRDPAPLGSLWWAVLRLCSGSEVILEGPGRGVTCKVTLWSTSLSPGASHSGQASHVSLTKTRALLHLCPPCLLALRP